MTNEMLSSYCEPGFRVTWHSQCHKLKASMVVQLYRVYYQQGYRSYE